MLKYSQGAIKLVYKLEKGNKEEEKTESLVMNQTCRI